MRCSGMPTFVPFVAPTFRLHAASHGIHQVNRLRGRTFSWRFNLLTSLFLLEEFWMAVKDIASPRDMTVSDLVAFINVERRHGNLSSAIRLFVLDFYRNQLSDEKPGRDGAAGYAVTSLQAAGSLSATPRIMTCRPPRTISQYQWPSPLGMTRNSILLRTLFLLLSLFSVSMIGLPRSIHGIDQGASG